MSLESLANFEWFKPRHPFQWLPVPSTLVAGDDEPVDEVAILVPAKSPFEFSSYRPLEDAPALFAALAECDDDDALARFATKFGTLGLSRDPDFGQEPEGKLPGGMKVRGESLRHWRDVHRDLQRAVHLWAAIVAEDVQRVEQICRDFPPIPGHSASLGPQGGLVYYQNDDDEYHALAQGWPDTHALHYGRLALAQRINNILTRPGGVGSIVALADERFSIRLWPRSLLGCAWYQFAAVVEGSAELRRCVACEAPFLVTHRSDRRGHRRYCTDACKQRSYRDRRARPRKATKMTRTRN